MKHETRILTKTLLFTLTASAFAFGAATAYANETLNDVPAQVDAKVRIYQKAVVSKAPALIRVDEPLPPVIVPLNTDYSPADIEMTPLTQIDQTYKSEAELTDLDLVEDNPIFVGTAGASEFDTLDAQREMGAYPEQMDVDPLFTVAGAGVRTQF
jgi:hypothetical protein